MANARSSIGRLMARVCGAAVALALARYSFLRWGVEGLTNLVFYTSCVAGTVTPYFFKGRRGMFWAGFGGYGILYQSVVLGFLNLPFRLPTSTLLDSIHDRLPANTSLTAMDFQRVGHAVSAVLFGSLVGFVLSTQVATKQVESEARPTLRAYFPSVFGLWDRLRFGRRS